jgi:endoglucanase
LWFNSTNAVIQKSFSLFVLLSLTVSYSQTAYRNQIGFKPHAYKAILAKDLKKGTKTFRLSNTKGEIVYKGKLTKPKTWEYSNESLQMAGFTDFDQLGSFNLIINKKKVASFKIACDLYQDILTASCRYFYLNRASVDLDEKYAGQFKRKAGHKDDTIYVHASATGPLRKENDIISSKGGWYDAGDYNKYIVNSAISCYTLMRTYENFSKVHETLKLNIPESNNSIPDLIDEIDYNIQWMLTMQDPADGGVYHKLTEKQFSAHLAPHLITEPRYVVMKTTSASLDFAATMAHYALITKDQALKNNCLKAAERAYLWAEQHQDRYYLQPKDINTGEYGDQELSDEWFWAKAELFTLTNQSKYNIDTTNISLSDCGFWQNVKALGFYTLAANKSEYQLFAQQQLQKVALGYLNYQQNKSANYCIMGNDITNFGWGSNAGAANQAILCIEASFYQNSESLQNAAWSNIHYLLGQNPTGFCFVTGFGQKSPLHPHHRICTGDEVDIPMPGMLVGGPNREQQDLKDAGPYPSNLPALSYLDYSPSYASNEVAINWNAPLVYLLSFANFVK